MCGIVGGITDQEVGPLLLEGLKQLEYRGYDSAGIAIINNEHELVRCRIQGKVQKLCESYNLNPINGGCGIAHTRWATHGVPCEENAHPHVSNNNIALVHNGIIENYEKLRRQLEKKGYKFTSQTDTEVIVHLIHSYMNGTNLLAAVQLAVKDLEGMYAIGVIGCADPGCVVAARSGSPLVIGLGKDENFIASDISALLALTQQFIYLEEGDIAKITKGTVQVFDANDKFVERKVHSSTSKSNKLDKKKYRHFMQKEIFEQPAAIESTLEGRIDNNKVFDAAFGVDADKWFVRAENATIVACGTSYYAALIARYWLEEIAGISCQVEIASEYRYRHSVVKPNSLFIAISQSGETADTLASFRIAKKQGYLTSLAICNVPESTLVREADLVLLTRAGPEIGVASTKAFTTQLAGLIMLTLAWGRHHHLKSDTEAKIVKDLLTLPKKLKSVLNIDDQVQALAQQFADKEHTLFLGRGSLFPVALEGALKLKEITYIHAEAYPAGELKHGPLALVDKNMPVIVVAPNNELYKKLKSNLEEVQARGGKLIVFADKGTELRNEPGIQILEMPTVDGVLAPILYVIPLQLLAYHVGQIKGTDVDQPRNLAKSVTVE